jgi:crotonobetainyl-CoA:carnitine CoA-transferase CaiB-like acyl-CoA transferase
VNISIENDEQWLQFRQAMGNPEWAGNEKFLTFQGRCQNHQELDELIEGWTSQHEHLEVMRKLQKAGIPSGAVLNMKEVNLDPHLIERGFFKVIDHGEGIGKRPIPSQLPAKFSHRESTPDKRAPHFAQDNKYVYGGLLGMSDPEIEMLEQQGVIGQIPTFPRGRPIRTNLIEDQKAAWFDPNYLSELRKRY